MALIIQKFGGTSIANISMIRKIASKIIDTYNAGNDIVIILSAMAGVTDKLMQLAHQISALPDKRELDVLLATGEQTTVSILAMILKCMGYKAKSILAYQLGLNTDSSYGNAKIIRVNTHVIKKILRDKTIAVIAGFQGCDSYGNITTLGRGGSDISAVAIAAALKADLCEIYTDVEGVYTVDPNVYPKARKLEKISYDEMFSMATLGTKVLHKDSISFAKDYNILLHVRSSFYLNKKGTVIVSGKARTNKFGILGIACDLNYSRIILRGVPTTCNIATELLLPVAKAGISLDMLFQNIPCNGFVTLMFTVPKKHFKRTLAIERSATKYIGSSEIISSSDNAKVSIVGADINKNLYVVTSIFKVLKKENINIIMMSMSKNAISFIISEKELKLAVKLLHSVFSLD